MGLLDNLGNIVKQAEGSPDVHAAYDQAVQSVPQGTLADGLTHAFNSDQTPPFDQMLSGLFNHSNPDQKAGILNKILGVLGPGGISSIASAAGLGTAAAAISTGSVTPQQAQEVSPEAVQVLAQQAVKKDPSVVDMAASFYAAHPTLIKSIGAGALALIMSKISQGRR